MSTRIKTLQNLLSEHKIDALLISNFYNILYLTGFQGLSPDEREAWVLVTKNHIYLFTDARYSDFSNKEISIFEITQEKPLRKHLKEIVLKEKITSSGCESEDLSMREYEILKQYLPSLKGIENIVKTIRTTKTTEEIAFIKKACELTDQCFKEISEQIQEGITEREIAFKIEMWIRSHNLDYAFYPIIAADENSAIPHFNTKQNGNGIIKNGSVLLLDFGIRYQNYCSDMTRMLCIGKPSHEYSKAYQALLHAQESAIQLLEHGAAYADIDSKVRKMIQKKGYPVIPHALGHGVGLEIHEYPKISHISTEHVDDGHAITIEPGIYIPGKLGIRIEDTVVIQDGKPEVLTNTSKVLNF